MRESRTNSKKSQGETRPTPVAKNCSGFRAQATVHAIDARGGCREPKLEARDGGVVIREGPARAWTDEGPRRRPAARRGMRTRR